MSAACALLPAVVAGARRSRLAVAAFGGADRCAGRRIGPASPAPAPAGLGASGRRRGRSWLVRPAAWLLAAGSACRGLADRLARGRRDGAVSCAIVARSPRRCSAPALLFLWEVAVRRLRRAARAAAAALRDRRRASPASLPTLVGRLRPDLPEGRAGRLGHRLRSPASSSRSWPTACPFLRRGLLPLGNFVAALPIIGIAPIMVMWFGFDWQSKAAVVVVMTFFPMLVNTVAGPRRRRRAWSAT